MPLRQWYKIFTIVIAELDESAYEALRNLAKRERRNVNDLVSTIVTDWLKLELTTPEYWDRQEKRDVYLVRSQLASATQVLLSGYLDWVSAEAQSLERLAKRMEYAGDSFAQRMVQQEIRRIQDINEHDLPEAKDSVQAKIVEVSDGDFSDIIDARRYLEEGLYRFEVLIRDLLACRKRLEEFPTAGDKVIEPPEGNGQYPHP